MAFDTDTYLKRAGGSLAQFVGNSLAEIEKSDVSRRLKFIAAFLAFLNGIKDSGFAPTEAKTLVETFLFFEGQPQTTAGGDLEVGGTIQNVKETELGIDVGIEFGAPAIPVAGGLSAGLDVGFGFRRKDSESTSQNFRAALRFFRASGPIKLSDEMLAKSVEAVLADPTIEIPTISDSNPDDSSDILQSQIVPFLTNVLGIDLEGNTDSD